MSAAGLIAGFSQQRLPGDGIEIDALVGGAGPPLLLLHGWPQTRMCWARVAPRLAQHFTVVVPDLRGYGRSGRPTDDPTPYAKRVMARDQIAAMAALGHDRFAVAGHDRGARVAYRLAFDHPQVVTRLACLDIVPTAEVWAAMRAEQAVGAWHWSLLAQPGELPARLIGADPAWFVRTLLGHEAGQPHFADLGLPDYIACASAPGAVQAWCDDYRAGWTVDRAVDEADRGRRLPMPLLVLWGAQGGLGRGDPLATWRAWAERVEGTALPCGHYLPEEAPEAVADHLLRFLGQTD